MNEFIVNSVSKILLILWLISALIITTQFTAYFLDFMVTTIPEIIVWTIEDLAERPDMKIITRDDYSLYAFAETEKTVLAQKIKKQLDPYFDYNEENVTQKLISGLNTGTSAYVHERLMMSFTLIKLTLEENVTFDSIHISTKSAEFDPYFIFVKGESPEWILPSLNEV